MKIGVLFDLDGTLLDTLEDLRDATNYALGVHGYPIRSLEEVRRFVGNGAENLIRRAVPSGAAEAEIQNVLATFRLYYNAASRPSLTTAFPKHFGSWLLSIPSPLFPTSRTAQ